MSGIAGWVHRARDVDTATARAMTAALARRGPERDETWIQGRAALGRAPATVEHVTVVVDGRADSEAMARAYLCAGESFVERLDGAFAFALWDARERCLVLGRDRFGVRPLYWFATGVELLFASEPKGVLANPTFRPRIDASKLSILLQPRLALPGETPLVGLCEVEPAQLVKWRDGQVTTCHYWRLESAQHEHDFDETARHVRELLEEAVAASTAPLAMLSGGVDSTSVAALAVRRQGTLDTFCLRFAGQDRHFVPTDLRPEIDAPYAAAAASHLGTRHHELEVTTHQVFDVVPATRRARDLPGWGQFDASMHLLFSEMRRHGRIALTGEAADEIFGGYPYFFKPEVLAHHGFPWLGDGPRFADCLAGGIDPRADERARYAELLARVPRLAGEDPASARMREALFLGMCGPLSVILDRKDRMSAACGVEVIVPFLDHRLVQYVWNVPWNQKTRGGMKGLLKAAMADVLPRANSERKKSAYPHLQSPEHDRALVEEALRIAENPASRTASLFDQRRLVGLIRELGGLNSCDARMLPGGASPAYLLINFIELEHWMAEHGVAPC